MWGDLNNDVALLEFFDSAAALGYAGVGTFDTHLHPYQDRPEDLRLALAARRLELVAVDTVLDDKDDAYVDHLAAFLGAVSCGLLVVIGGQGVSEDDMRQVAARLNTIGALTARHGVTTLYHHHSGTIGATADQVARLVDFLDLQSVALLADTGHIALDMDVMPAAFIRQHATRLRLVEFKDYAPERGLGYELGRGGVDFPAVARVLHDLAYEGWIMVEQNQTTCGPRASAALSRAYLRDTLGW